MVFGWAIMKIDTPLISIVTIVYNDKDGVKKTINNIINQTYRNIEFIIIDGGSTDGTVDIIKKYRESIAYWISEKDGGIYDAFNKGLDIATGDFINFMNAGDTFYESQTIEKSVEKINHKNKVYFGKVIVKYKGKSCLYPDLNNSIKRFAKKRLPNHQSMFFPKNFYQNNKYNLNYKISADDDYKFRSINDYGLEFIDMTICEYSRGGVSANFNDISILRQRIVESWKIFRMHIGLIRAVRSVIQHVVLFIIQKLFGVKFFYRVLDFFRR